jgi:hypothetical protein
MARLSWGLALVSSVIGAVNAVSWSAVPFSPPSYPLAVRSPYLSAWLPQGAGTALNGAWPTFWTGSILGWAGFVNVGIHEWDKLCLTLNRFMLRSMASHIASSAFPVSQDLHLPLQFKKAQQ